jgi:hypothetical protein
MVSPKSAAAVFSARNGQHNLASMVRRTGQHQVCFAYLLQRQHRADADLQLT